MNSEKTQAGQSSPVVPCSTNTTEEYYIKRDEFMRYIAFEVNPARLAAGLSEIREHEAQECYRIIIDFQRKWNEPSSNTANEPCSEAVEPNKGDEE